MRLQEVQGGAPPSPGWRDDSDFVTNQRCSKLPQACLPPDPAKIDLQLFAGDKQEPATARHRQKAREHGQVFQSREVASSLLLLGAVLVLRSMQGTLLARGEDMVTGFLGNVSFTLNQSSVFFIYRTALGDFLDLLLLSADDYDCRSFGRLRRIAREGPEGQSWRQT